MAPTELPSPRHSRSSSTASTTSSKRPKSNLTLDLSDLPPLITPAEPSNTLIITNLHDLSIFHPASLATIRDTINTHAPIHTFAPLKSFRRIVVSFFDVAAATSIRQELDGTHIMGCPARVFFGTATPLNQADQHLELPKSNKLFFISPPPSPPHGWEMRNEEPPNKQVHAEDLASALAKLRAQNVERDEAMGFGVPASATEHAESSPRDRTRKRGSSIVVYHPEDFGDSPDLPAIAVEDTTNQCGSPAELSPMEMSESSTVRFLRTERPPMDFAQTA